MPNRRVNVVVRWCGKKALNLPECELYTTIAKFKEDLNWENEAWSITLAFENTPKAQGNPSMAFAYFLMPSAPSERLFKGAEFELFEGGLLVAKVEVV